MLFADLVGFTPLSESRDPEDVRALLSRYFDIARTIVSRHGGVVEKFIGDAVMAVWGTPVATEQDAERAVRAGLELVDAVTVLGTETAIAGLAARAGVVTGEVAVTIGAVGEGMVAGDAVNTAARVQAAAPAGHVFVDATTRRLAAAAIGFADAGTHTLKGKAEPEQLWQVTRVIAAVGGAQRVDGLEAGLVGRDSELRLIKELFHAAADRRTPRLLVVAGASGVGKSRLGWEFEKYIDGLASVVLWHRGRCLSYGEGIAFWALAEAVRQRFGIADEDPTTVAAEKMDAALPEIVPDADERSFVAARLGRLLGLPSSSAAATLAREELFAGWRIFFERLAAQDPVVLLIEDGQHADSGLLDFIDHLIDWARELPIFVMVLTRPELEERRPGFGVGRNRTALTLDPLDPASMDQLVAALVAGIPAQARKAITAHAQGVPLFAVETVRSLVDRDIVQPIDGAYRLVGDVGELSVPDSLHALLAARLDALPAGVRALVADAAVLGNSFPAEAVVAVSDQPEAAVHAGLAELLRREVLAISADPLSPQRGEYRFAQQLLRQVAYDTLSRRDRKRRHLAVAAHLRAAFPNDGEEVSDAIARHYRDALTSAPDDSDADEIREQAIRIGMRAADRANRGGAPATAGDLFAMAGGLAEEHGGTIAAAEAWEKSADAARVANDVDRCVERAERAHALYTAAGQERDAARVLALAGASLSARGLLTQARERLEAALTVLRTDPDVDTVRALLYVGQIDNMTGLHGPNSYTQQALTLGQELDVDDAIMAEIFAAQGVQFAIADRPAEASAALEHSARLAQRVGDRAGEGKALTNLSDTLAPIDPRAAADAARSSADLSRQVGARRMLGFAIANLAEALLTAGDWDEAASVLRAGFEQDGLSSGEIAQLNLVRLHALRGDVEATRELLATGVDMFRASEDPQDRSAICLLEALLAVAEGDDASALERAQASLAYEPALGIRSESIRWAASVVIRSARNLGDRATQQQLLDWLDGYAIGKLPLVLRAERDLLRAHLTAGVDDVAALQLFARAIDAHRNLPALFHLGHALLDYAELLGATGDRYGAELAVAEAAHIAHQLGAQPLARRAAAAAESAAVQ